MGWQHMLPFFARGVLRTPLHRARKAAAPEAEQQWEDAGNISMFINRERIGYIEFRLDKWTMLNRTLKGNAPK